MYRVINTKHKQTVTQWNKNENQFDLTDFIEFENIPRVVCNMSVITLGTVSFTRGEAISLYFMHTITILGKKSVTIYDLLAKLKKGT